MTEQRFQDIWKRQCESAHAIRADHGVVSALEYLIGEKLQTYAESAVTRPEFAQELPSFIAAVRGSFSAEEIICYLNHLERMTAIDDEQVVNDPDGADDDFLCDTPEQITARRARFLVLKELLTSNLLGTA